MAEDQPGEIELVYLTLEDILELYGLIVGATVAEAADYLRRVMRGAAAPRWLSAKLSSQT